MLGIISTINNLVARLPARALMLKTTFVAADIHNHGQRYHVLMATGGIFVN